jgi:hypothetical protein
VRISDVLVNYPIFFLNRFSIASFFLSNRSGEASWKATIARYELTGQHLNFTDEEFNLLSQAFKINGIPHYVITDKGGRIVNAMHQAQLKKRS